jgi:hypothetical protein
MPELIRIDDHLKTVQFEDGNWIFRALNDQENSMLSDLDDSILNILHLPDASVIDNNHDCSEILNELELILRGYADINEEEARLLSAFVLSSYFADEIPISPSVILMSRNVLDVVPLYAVMTALCRRTLPVEARSIARLPYFLRPTLAIDASTLDEHELEKFNGVNTKVVRRLIDSRLEATASHRVFMARRSFPAGAFFSINVAAARSIPDERELKCIASRFVNILTNYRLRNRAEVHEAFCSRHDGSVLSRVLESCIVNEPERRAQVSAAALRITETCLSDPENMECDTLLEILFAEIHKDISARITIKQLAECTQQLLELRGTDRPISSKMVCSFLRRSGLYPYHTREGNVIELNGATKETIHRLHRQIAITNQATYENCTSCRTGPSESSSV